jgi:penicillin-insensitive murein endopeptidase
MAMTIAAVCALGPARPARAEPVVGPPRTVSCGHPTHGLLSQGVMLPPQGAGYAIAQPWRHRHRWYGTEALVALIRRAAARVASDFPDSTLAVGDLSRRGGGKINGHFAHQSGRDVDFIYYAVDPSGHPFAQDGFMAAYRADGLAVKAHAPRRARIRERFFDVARNWALVRALVTDEAGVVRRIVVSPRVEHWLIGYAREIGEPRALIARAAALLDRPPYVHGHSDHMHVQIACPAEDAASGACIDGAPWQFSPRRMPRCYRAVHRWAHCGRHCGGRGRHPRRHLHRRRR